MSDLSMPVDKYRSPGFLQRRYLRRAAAALPLVPPHSEKPCKKQGYALWKENGIAFICVICACLPTGRITPIRKMT